VLLSELLLYNSIFPQKLKYCHFKNEFKKKNEVLIKNKLKLYISSKYVEEIYNLKIF
jgi:hypothetical protein